MVFKELSSSNSILVDHIPVCVSGACVCVCMCVCVYVCVLKDYFWNIVVNSECAENTDV